MAGKQKMKSRTRVENIFIVGKRLSLDKQLLKLPIIFQSVILERLIDAVVSFQKSDKQTSKYFLRTLNFFDYFAIA